MEEKKEQKVATKYYCEICDYSTSRKYNFIKHKTTRKHLKLTNVDTTTTINSNYICECGWNINIVKVCTCIKRNASI